MCRAFLGMLTNITLLHDSTAKHCITLLRSNWPRRSSQIAKICLFMFVSTTLAISSPGFMCHCAPVLPPDERTSILHIQISHCCPMQINKTHQAWDAARTSDRRYQSPAPLTSCRYSPSFCTRAGCRSSATAQESRAATRRS